MLTSIGRTDEQTEHKLCDRTTHISAELHDTPDLEALRHFARI